MNITELREIHIHDGIETDTEQATRLASKAERTLWQILFGIKRFEDGRYNHWVENKLEDYPRGYPQLAGYVVSDINTKLFRRFSYIRTMLLIRLQVSISELERKLVTLDRHDEVNDPFLLSSISADEAENGNPERKVVLQNLKTELKEYDDLLLRENAITALPRASRKTHLSFFNYVWNNKPVEQAEMSFIYHRDDFVALGMNEDSWFLSFTDKIRALIPRKIAKSILVPGTNEVNTSMDRVHLYSNSKLSILAKILLAIVSTGLLMCPCIILFLVDMSRSIQVGIAFIAVLAFSFTISIFTRAKLHEVFMATAAYAAVLVVFLGTHSN